ncbi:MAG: putative acetyltransferase [Paenibacillaceae bacterium]|jgi:ribosomal protein S18 acetylase RimI-like enzyme|nr:putative acetyltransferase [Paenibacillaceae bacterium]
MIISRAAVEDLENILALQYQSFRSEAEIYNDFSIKPLKQTLADIEEEWNRMIFLKAEIDGQIVGSVRAYEQEGTCYISKLIVHPSFQNRRIGTSLMNNMEQEFGSCKRYEIFTGHRSIKNLYLYKKLGYKDFKTIEVNDKLKQIHLFKEQ